MSKKLKSQEIDVPYVHIESQSWHENEDYDNPVTLADSKRADLNDVVIPEGVIVIKFTYPLSGEFLFTFKSKKGFTRRKLVELICFTYQKIYDEENGTSKVKEQSYAEASGGTSSLMNRVETDGKYGIWGHCIGDLVLEGVDVERVPRLSLVVTKGIASKTKMVPVVHLSIGS